MGPTQTPPGRNMHRMRKLVLGFCLGAMLVAACGESPTTPDSPLFGTWLWNGSSWTQLARSSGSEAEMAPGFPGGESLTYWKDFGGLIDADGTRWNGSAWVAGASTYPAHLKRSASGEEVATVLDVGRDQLIFVDPNSETISVWSNGIWKEVVASPQWPMARYLRGIAYDPAHAEVMILTCCGVDGLGPQTWIWTGKSLIEAPGLPTRDAVVAARASYELVPDGEGHMLAFGAGAGFSWDGQAWSALDGHPELPGAGVVSVVRDSTHGETFAIGPNNSDTLGVWRWQDGKWQAVGSGLGPPALGCDLSNPVFDPDMSGIVITDLWADCNISVLP